MKSSNQIKFNKETKGLLSVLVYIFLTVAAHSVFAQPRCANFFSNAGSSKSILSEWAQIQSATHLDLLSAGFSELKVDTNGLQGAVELGNKAGLFEIVFEYEKDGKSIREVGLSKNIYQMDVALFRSEDGKTLHFRHKKDGVEFRRVMYRGGLSRTDSQLTYLPSEQMKKENEGNIFAFHIKSSVLGLDQTVVGKMKIVPEGYEFSGIGDIYVVDPVLIQQLGRGQVEMFLPLQDGKIPSLRKTDVVRKIVLAEQDGKKRTETFMNGLAKGEVYSPDFFDWFKIKPEKTKLLINRLFNKHNPSLLISRVSDELGESYLSLFLHPKIAERWGEVLEFAKELKNKSSDISNYQIFKAFEKEQGTVRLLRGLILTEKEFSEINKKGMLPPGLVNAEEAKAWMLNFYNEYSDDPALLSHINSGKFDRDDATTVKENDLAGYGLIQSFTMEPEIARSVPYWLKAEEQFPHKPNEVLPVDQRLKPGYSLYVFEVEVPKWDVSYAKDYYNSGLVLAIGDKEWLMRHDHRFEQYVPLALPLTAIKSVEKINEVPPKFAKQYLKPNVRPNAY